MRQSHWQRLSMLATSAAVLCAMPLPGRVALGACRLGELVQLPVTMVGLRPTIPVAINGVAATFAVDSGAFFSMMTPAAAAQFHLPQRAAPDHLQINGIGGRVNYSVATVSHFGLGPLDLQIPRGAIYALVGPNGAGKSPTLSLLMGAGRPDRGEIEILGLP